MEVKINGVDIGTSVSSAAAKVLINETTSQHGVVASGRTELALDLDFNGITASDNDDVKINGVEVDCHLHSILLPLSLQSTL